MTEQSRIHPSTIRSILCIFVFTADIACATTDVAPSRCAGCHGEQGTSKDPSLPNLAGQSPEYTTRQLLAFKTGTRKNPIMNRIAQTLSDSEMQDLAAYFAAQIPKIQPASQAPDDHGKSIYTRCWGCHGETALGGEGFPRLAGQKADYLVNQLKRFQSGTRKNPAMNSILETMNGNDFSALANYLASLQTD